MDEAALVIAKQFGLETGGWMPKGFKTLDGNKPEFADLYGMREHSSSDYKDRTWDNVKDSDGTLRIAANFSSLGEKCTINAVKFHKKPHIDIKVKIDMFSPIFSYGYDRLHDDVVKWIIDNDINVLNIAGNSERTAPGIHKAAKIYLYKVLESLGFSPKNSVA